MKKIYKLILLFFITFSILSCSDVDVLESFTGEKFFGLTKEEEFRNNLKNYKLEAKIYTTKGDIRIYLYPEAAPKLVANFVFLSLSGYYDGLSFHRVNVNDVIQTGDRVGDGTGTPGYSLDDEFSFLKFDRSGIVAMANAGSNTNGSQFFITLQTNPQYNGYYSIIGNVKTEDISTARLIRQDDKIKTIEISGINVDKFLDNFKEDVEIWKSKLETTGFKIK